MRLVPFAAVVLAAALASSPDALAQTTRQTGFYAIGAGGLGLGDAPLSAGLGWQATVGIWKGNYDNVYALGRHWGFGATVRQDLGGDEDRLAIMAELRRGLDLFVLGGHTFLAIGPEWGASSEPGLTARTGLALKYRPHRYVQPTLRFEVGATYREKPAFQAGVLLGLEISAPIAGVDR